MSCSNCTTHKNHSETAPKGCKNHGVCGTDSCNKLAIFDWLANISLPAGQEKFDCVEVRFKNSRKEFFRNTEKLALQMGDIVATEASSGHDIGIVTLTGELVKVQMSKKKVNTSEGLPKVYRKANPRDVEVWQEARNREEIVQKKSRELAIALGLEMKISDVEFQGDGSKATFYYTAEDRVDFRQLIKDMAREFSTRIEMRQIGFRQEAARLGGIGSCGRELCCSTWLTDFRSVNTSAARYQQLSLNPQKLAGQCGKLKCCLNYELDSYMDALKDFPKMETRLHTKKGIATCQKVDIFKRLMWFTYEEDTINWHKLTVEQVKEILDFNAKNQPVASIEEYASKLISDTPVIDFQNSTSQESLTRFDSPKTSKKKKAKKKKPSENGQSVVQSEKNTEQKQVQKSVQNKNEKQPINKNNKPQQGKFPKPKKEKINVAPQENPNPNPPLSAEQQPIKELEVNVRKKRFPQKKSHKKQQPKKPKE